MLFSLIQMRVFSLERKRDSCSSTLFVRRPRIRPSLTQRSTEHINRFQRSQSLSWKSFLNTTFWSVYQASHLQDFTGSLRLGFLSRHKNILMACVSWSYQQLLIMIYSAFIIIHFYMFRVVALLSSVVSRIWWGYCGNTTAMVVLTKSVLFCH